MVGEISLMYAWLTFPADYCVALCSHAPPFVHIFHEALFFPPQRKYPFAAMKDNLPINTSTHHLNVYIHISSSCHPR